MKKLFVYISLFICVCLLLVSPFINNCDTQCVADGSGTNLSFYMPKNDHNLEVVCNYTNTSEVKGVLNVDLSVETNKEKIKRYEGFSKKQRIDSGDIGELFYTTITYQQASNEDSLSTAGSKYQYVVKINKNINHKELTVVPFVDEVSTGSIIVVKDFTDNNGDRYITFTGSTNYSAYAIVYNGVYKDLILMGVILVSVLIICIVVKLYCLKKDNPYYLEKLKQKAILRKKEKNKESKKMAQALKREKEKSKQSTK